MGFLFLGTLKTVSFHKWIKINKPRLAKPWIFMLAPDHQKRDHEIILLEKHSLQTSGGSAFILV